MFNNYNNFNNNYHHVPTLDEFRKFCEPFYCNEMGVFYKYIEQIRQEKLQKFKQCYQNYYYSNYNTLKEIEKLNEETRKILNFKDPTYCYKPEYECIKKFQNFMIAAKDDRCSFEYYMNGAGIKNEGELYKIEQIMNDCKKLNKQQKNSNNFIIYSQEMRLKQQLQEYYQNNQDRIENINRSNDLYNLRYKYPKDVEDFCNIYSMLCGYLSERKKLGLDGITDFNIIKRKIDQVISNIENKINYNNRFINNYNNNYRNYLPYNNNINYPRVNNYLNNYDMMSRNYRPINHNNASYNNRAGYNRNYNNYN